MDLQQTKADITVGISQEQLKQRVTEEHTREISLKMTKWEDWASALKLTPTQIEDIDANRTMHGKRLAVLRVWEESFGSTATYEKLIDALLKFKMRKMAEFVCSLLKMPSVAISSPEYDAAFLLHYAKALNTIQDPLSLAARLFAKGVIDCTVLQSVTAVPRLQSTRTLLSAVGVRIQTDPGTFEAFVSTVKEDPSLQPLVESMEGECFIMQARICGGGALGAVPGPTTSPEWWACPSTQLHSK